MQLLNNNILKSLFFLLVIVSPLYVQPNLGGAGLYLTFNIAVWFAVIVFISASFFKNNSQLKLPKLWPLLCVFPLFTTFNNILSVPVSASNLLFTLLFIWIGVLFIIRLFQLDLKQPDIDAWLFVIVIASLVQAIISVCQIWTPNSFISQFFFSAVDSVPRGVFQQVNVNASFLATAITIIIYLISRPWFSSARLLTKVILFMTYTLALYTLFASGSRVGLLALILAVPLLFIVRIKQFKKHKKAIAILILLAIPTFFLGQSGIEKTVDKSIQLKEQTYSNARIAMYSIGAELVIKQPMGYGLGNFLKAWTSQVADFVKRHPETRMPAYINHPHNEFLMWMIEGGIPALIGLLMVSLAICMGLWQCGWQRGGAYAAMLIPISLHTQVELPFYLSSLHWFVWLFLVFVVLRHNMISIDINLSKSASKSVKYLSVIFSMIGALLLFNTAQAQKDIYNFVQGIDSNTPPLSIALGNIYTQSLAERLAMRSMLYNSIEKNDTTRVKEFERWAMAYIEKRPELKMYEDLITVSLYLRPENKGCDAIDLGYKNYPHAKSLKEARTECLIEGLL